MSDRENMVRQILSDHLGKSTDELHRGTSLQGDLDIDSTEMVELFCAIERSFKITFPEGAEREVKTVGDVCDLIDRAAASQVS
ncbi:acyl carrier protein [Sorangium sp. So ce341]|uniref:acyl carrier protein n=1 Tax=Sorangium sp. So ce341 TaxID=3133302 RepID=UPI003F61F1F3